MIMMLAHVHSIYSIMRAYHFGVRMAQCHITSRTESIFVRCKSRHNEALKHLTPQEDGGLVLRSVEVSTVNMDIPPYDEAKGKLQAEGRGSM